MLGNQFMGMPIAITVEGKSACILFLLVHLLRILLHLFFFFSSFSSSSILSFLYFFFFSSSSFHEDLYFSFSSLHSHFFSSFTQFTSILFSVDISYFFFPLSSFPFHSTPHLFFSFLPFLIFFFCSSLFFAFYRSQYPHPKYDHIRSRAQSCPSQLDQHREHSRERR